MHALGLVHVLAEPGQGEQAVRAYIAKNGRRQAGHRGIYHASGLVNPVTLQELQDVVEVWADSALRLTDGDLKLMKRLVDAQARLAA
jgi:DSF synthase